MNELKCRTRGSASPQGRSRVYFTCHPADYSRSFDRICEDIFSSHDCAIYYTEDMTARLPEETRETDMAQMNLFVIPVSGRLLTEPNRAMDEDFPFAKAQHIPVLPILLEPGLTKIYSRADRFGALQYLNPDSHDMTEIPYAEKLKHFLESVLIGGEQAKRIRAAFDAYIFLSYRKKDRKYANELMRLIHSDPICRDIAIWYDEFLTPGESFSDAIGKRLTDSQLFTLLVTPNLVNEQNYVQRVEYPAAREYGKKILPAVMEKTDPELLARQYEGLPEVVDGRDQEALRSRLQASFRDIARHENDEDPTHNFLIGLAYLEGIDVEVDRTRALELITSAAEAELPEAMKKLCRMYSDGVGVALDLQKALNWYEKLYRFYVKTEGEDSTPSLNALNDLANAVASSGDYQRAIELQKKACALAQKLYSEEDDLDAAAIAGSMNNLAIRYFTVHDYRSAADILEQAYPKIVKGLGETDRFSLIALSNLGSAYLKAGEVEKGRKCQEKAVSLMTATWGKENRYTIQAIQALAYAYGLSGDMQRQKDMQDKVYELSCRLLGHDHPETIFALVNLAKSYAYLDDYKKELELAEEAYLTACRVLGETHPHTVRAQKELNIAYWNLGNHLYAESKYQEALPLYERIYEHHLRTLGKNAPDTLNDLQMLIRTCNMLRDNARSLELYHELYSGMCGIKGENDPETLKVLSNIALSNVKMENYEEAASLLEQVYSRRCEVLGEKHPDTMETLYNWAVALACQGELARTDELFEQLYPQRCQVLGPAHPDTLEILSNRATINERLGNQKKLVQVLEELYTQYCETLGETHKDTLETLSRLALALRELGEKERTEEMFRRLYQQQCAVLGETHPDTLQSLAKWALALGKLGQTKKEEELEEKLYYERCAVLGETDSWTLQTLSNWALTLGELGEYEREEELEEKLYSQRLAVLGEDHEDTIKTLANWTLTLRSLERWDKMAEKAKVLWECRKRTLGENDLKTNRAASYLAEARGKMASETGEGEKDR